MSATAAVPPPPPCLQSLARPIPTPDLWASGISYFRFRRHLPLRCSSCIFLMQIEEARTPYFGICSFLLVFPSRFWCLISRNLFSSCCKLQWISPLVDLGVVLGLERTRWYKYVLLNCSTIITSVTLICASVAISTALTL